LREMFFFIEWLSFRKSEVVIIIMISTTLGE